MSEVLSWRRRVRPRRSSRRSRGWRTPTGQRIEWFSAWPPVLLAMAQGGFEAVLSKGMRATVGWKHSEVYEVDLHDVNGQIVMIEARTPACPK